MHRKAWDTQVLYIQWFHANKLTRHWTKLYPSVALVLLYRELILPDFFPKSVWEFLCIFLLMYSVRLWKWSPAVIFFGSVSTCSFKWFTSSSTLSSDKVCILYLLLLVIGPRGIWKPRRGIVEFTHFVYEKCKSHIK